MSVLRDLDDPVPLADLGPAQRAAVIARGEHLRRRHRLRMIAVPVAAAAVVAAVAVTLAADADTARRDLAPPASLSPSTLVLGEERTGREDVAVCEDAAGDSVGDPDVDFFSLDRPGVPLFHYALVNGEMPTSGVVVFRIEATSADGTRSRELVQRTVDDTVVEQYVRDPRTGARVDVPRDRNPFGDPGDHGVGGADFPAGAVGGLGDRWTWEASISVNGSVVDACAPTPAATP
jgi:hypothetical protein